MKELDLTKVTEEVARLCIEANYFIGKDVMGKIKEALEKEESPVGKNILEQIITNDGIAADDQVPMCQDTGLAVVFLEVGTEVKINGDIYEAINAGVRKGYEEGYLRKSAVRHPLDRVNTKDNTPAIIHTKLVPGSDKVKIIVAPKGGGSENMSYVKMLAPAAGVEGVKNLIIEAIKAGGGNPCPPMVVGVGLGGTFEKAALLAKEALMRDLNDKSPDPVNAKLEDELLELINNTGVGPLGLGGKVTALTVKVNSYPCHIASLPVAVNINCHAARHKEVIL
ncbi:fumarate hydratase [Ilyobacter polytropus]|uniref:Fumarase alpha subunit n=1 Tax=Ilyobacter polytropus (strain ATCC 51220 / DSM 2926 / LMG 16218 / CuHBu1) TaxID=572544 RepID=E3HBI1_ILYPC|nr:fumarate hydratase [Ilyobacter polytropus]ADO83796.1 fumarase alpha subunit [Ilyobacter polytropus DSM 2926]